MTSRLVDQICRKHLITKTKLASDSRAPLVVEAREDFIKTAHKEMWSAQEIANVLKSDKATIQYQIKQFFRDDNDAAPPCEFAPETAAPHATISPVNRVMSAAPLSISWSNPFAEGRQA